MKLVWSYTKRPGAAFKCFKKIAWHEHFTVDDSVFNYTKRGCADNNSSMDRSYLSNAVCKSRNTVDPKSISKFYRTKVHQ